MNVVVPAAHERDKCEVLLTVKNPHPGYKKGKVIHLKCSGKYGQAAVVETVKNFQLYGAWLEDQWHSPQNMAKIAKAKSTAGTPILGLFLKEYAAKYDSAAKVTLEETVIPRGCKHADATKIFAFIHDNRVKGKMDCALQDVEQTCVAFRVHFDRPANRAECIKRFAFCLHFYKTMQETLQAIDAGMHYQMKQNATDRLGDVLKSLKRILLDSADQRKDLRAAFMECDVEYCSQMLVGGGRRVLLPLSDLQATTNKAAKLSADKEWEMFFTMILLESTVFLRLQEVQYTDQQGRPVVFELEQISQRQTPLRGTASTKVASSHLGEIVAKATGDGCFDVLPFCAETFKFIVVTIYGFPKTARAGGVDGHQAQTIDIAAFFELATKCSVATTEMFDAVRLEMLKGDKFGSTFASSFLLELRRAQTEDAQATNETREREKRELFVLYFDGFMSHDLNINICNLYSPLLESGQMGDMMPSLFEAVMQRLQARPPQLADITRILDRQLDAGHPLKRDRLMQHILLDFFDSRPVAAARSGTYKLGQYKRDILRVFELLQASWSLDFGGKGQVIVSRVAFDLLEYGATAYAYQYGGEGGERLATLCEVIKDPNYCALVQSAVPQRPDDLVDRLNNVVDGLTMQNAFKLVTLSKLLDELAPDDAAMTPVGAATAESLPATYVVWLRICERLGHRIAIATPADKLTGLKLLAESGHKQMFQASIAGGGQTRQLACTMFYNLVLLGPTLRAATFTAEDAPKWTNLVRVDFFGLICRAVEIFRQGLHKCAHPLAVQHLVELTDVVAALAGLRGAFESKDLSLAELMQLKNIINADATVSGVLRIEEAQINITLVGVADDVARLKEVKHVVQFLGTLNVERGRDEQDIARLIDDSQKVPTGEIGTSARDFIERYRTGYEGLGVKLYDLVIHFQREKSVIFDATVETLRKSEGVGVGDPCEVERAKELMEQVDKQLFALLARTITVDKLRPILPALRNCDIPAEIIVLRSWQDYGRDGAQAAQEIRLCMELLQQVQNVPTVLAVLRKYDIVAENDADEATLRRIHGTFDAAGEREEMALRDVPRNCQELEDLFSGLKATHFKLIETIKDAEHLVRFLDKDTEDGTDFYSEDGKRNFADKKRLVDVQIQASASRQYHSQLLSAFELDAMPVCECFAVLHHVPLRDAIQRIADVERLNVPEGEEPPDIDSLCKKIKMSNDNIVTIRSWFTRAQVSTTENAGFVMSQIKQTGKLTIELRDLIFDGMSTQDKKRFKAFQIEYQQGDQGMDDGNAASVTLSVGDVDDLQRQLTFSLQQHKKHDKHSEDYVQEKASLDVLHLLRTIFKRLKVLQESGHPFYQNRSFDFDVRTDEGHKQRLIGTERDLTAHLSDWERALKKIRQDTKQLQMLTCGEVAIIVHLLSEHAHGEQGGTRDILKTLLGTEVDLTEEADVTRAVHFCIGNLLRPVSDLCICEAGLHSPDTEQKTNSVTQHLHPLCDSNASAEDAVRAATDTMVELVEKVFRMRPGHNAGDCGTQFGFKVKEPSDVFLVLLQDVFKHEEPTNSQILWCTDTTNERDVALFFQRIRSFRSHNFVVCGMGRLIPSARERVYDQQRELHRRQKEQEFANVYFVTLGTSTAVGSVAHFIRDRGIVQKAPVRVGANLWPRAGATRCTPTRVCALVGEPGSGKTHKLKEKLKESERRHRKIQVLSLVDNIHRDAVSRKLASLEFQRAAGDAHSSIFINVSDVVPAHHVGKANGKADGKDVRTNFFYDVNRLLFEVMVLGYTQQSAGGSTFTLSDEDTEIFIEVPARENAEHDYLEMTPVLQIVGAEQEVQNDVTNLYEIQIPSQAQRVAMVLNALHTPNQHGRAIDAVANYDHDGNAQKTLTPLNTAEECRETIMNQLTDIAQVRDLARPGMRVRKGDYLVEEGDYLVEMGKKIAASKLLQKCFLAYLGRRCEYYFKDMSQFTLNGDPRMKLGTTTSRQFIRESIELCDNEHDVDDNGEYLLLGEDYYLALLRKSHAGLGVPTCSSVDLARMVAGTDKDIDKELQTTQADIDRENRRTITTRLEGRWDHYLARGLAFGGNAQTGSAKVRKVLDDMNFVMVSDFCFKIVHIHERKLAGLPVIIEGETGVGKTYLLDCYANLLASQLRRTRREPARQPVRICMMMEELCKKIKKMVTDAGGPGDNPDAALAVAQLDARRWQLENETNARYGADNDERNLHPVDTPAMLEQWEWIVSIGCPHAVVGQDWAWLAPETRDAIKKLCVDTLVDIVAEWRDVPLLDRHGEFDRLERRATANTSEFEERTKGDFRAAVDRWLEESNEKMVVETKLVFQSFLACGNIPMFYRLMVHPGITPDEVMQFLMPIRELARNLQLPDDAVDKVSEVSLVCFFDEVNTAECQGLVKEILYDRSIGGDQLEENLFFIAAINPDKREYGQVEDDEHLAFINGKKALSVKAIHREYYQVNRMHPVLRTLKWNYTKLGNDNLQLYIHHKVTSYSKGGAEFSRVTHDLLALVIQESQNFMMENLGQSSVSQRDVQRCFTLIEFFRKHAPAELQREGTELMMQSAVMLAASVAYFFRLPTEEVIGLDNRPVCLREKFLRTVEKVCRNKFRFTVNRCVDNFVTRHNFDIQKGIALNQALKENIFCMVAALETNIPVSIIGLPGSSKTLSFQIVQRNLRGDTDSPTEFCQRFKEIQAFFYQCNEYSTEQEIASVFNLAIERQNDLDAAARGKANKRCVVFLDEASLPDEKKNVLKVLHPYLDEHRVAAVVISNVPLDAANANRLIEVHRGVGSDADLEVLARGCLGVDDERSGEDMQLIVNGLCQGYKGVIDASYPLVVEGHIAPGQEAEVRGLTGGLKYLNGTKAIVQVYNTASNTYNVSITLGGEPVPAPPLPAENLRRVEMRKLFPTFHFRDFIYLLRHINRVNSDDQLTALTEKTLLTALECNFGGIPDDQFTQLADIFFKAVSTSLDDPDFALPDDDQMRTPLQVFRQSLEDAKVATKESDQYSELHPRFKLIIDSSEDDSAARLLETVGVEFDEVFRMSDFPDDNTELHYARLISDIKMSMERGDTILLIDTDRIQGSFCEYYSSYHH